MFCTICLQPAQVKQSLQIRTRAHVCAHLTKVSCYNFSLLNVVVYAANAALSLAVLFRKLSQVRANDLSSERERRARVVGRPWSSLLLGLSLSQLRCVCVMTPPPFPLLLLLLHEVRLPWLSKPIRTTTTTIE